MALIHGNTAFTLDGVSDFTVGATTFTWNGGFLESLDIFSNDVGQSYTVTAALTGSNWSMGRISIGGATGATVGAVINDGAIGSGRFIELLSFFGLGGSQLTLINTEISSITGSKGIDTVNTSTNWIGSIQLFEGNDTVNVSNGNVDSVNLGNGTNTFTSTNGHVSALVGLDGNDTATIGAGGVETVNFGQGNNTITTGTTGFVGTILTYNGNDTVHANCDVNSIIVGNGTNVVTVGTGPVAAIVAFDGNDTVTLGTGNVGTITVGGGQNVVTTSSGGVAAIVSYAGNDTITVGTGGVGTINAGNGLNTITLFGGTSHIFGGLNSDTYNLGSNNTTINDNGGIDTITSTISRDLNFYGSVDRLTLLGPAAATGRGNALSNAITGNTAANTLDGGLNADTLLGLGGNDTLIGGAGIDTLTGGANNDFFVFNAPLSAANRDNITDFSAALDTFRLENAIMTKVGAAGALAAKAFFAGASAHDADDRIIYNKATGVLLYDSNGNLAGGVTQLATLTTLKPTLTFADFVVI